MKHEAELTTHIIHQLNFEFIYIFSEAMSKLASLSKPKPYLPMHLYLQVGQREDINHLCIICMFV